MFLLELFFIVVLFKVWFRLALKMTINDGYYNESECTQKLGKLLRFMKGTIIFAVNIENRFG